MSGGHATQTPRGLELGGGVLGQVAVPGRSWEPMCYEDSLKMAPGREKGSEKEGLCVLFTVVSSPGCRHPIKWHGQHWAEFRQGPVKSVQAHTNTHSYTLLHTHTHTHTRTHAQSSRTDTITPGGRHFFFLCVRVCVYVYVCDHLFQFVSSLHPLSFTPPAPFKAD